MVQLPMAVAGSAVSAQWARAAGNSIRNGDELLRGRAGASLQKRGSGLDMQQR